jgi:hypothetical protein
MGFGYFFAIALNMPPLEDGAIDARQVSDISTLTLTAIKARVTPPWI